MMEVQHRISTEAQLAEIIGEPIEMLDLKVLPALDGAMRQFIEASPLIFLATVDGGGRPDLSPKGDPAGFVQIDASGNLSIPERPGNRLTFGFKNILRNANIGLIFVIPGERETLRVKGKATLHKDPDVLEALAVNGKPAIMCTHVEVQECFFHCGKAMIRSKAWKPQDWQSIDKSLMVRNLTETLNGDEALEEILNTEIEKSYVEELY